MTDTPNPRRAPSGPGRREPAWWRLFAVVAVTAMTSGYFVLPLDEIGPHRPVASWTVFALALSGVSVLLLVQIRDVVAGGTRARPGIVIPLLMCLSIVIFAGAYYALAKQPGQFDGLTTRVDALYFTVTTLATVGYGDITPSGQTSRVVTMVQILYTFVFLTAATGALTRTLRGRLGERLRQSRDLPSDGPS
ncbi:potassium channel family protein [Streptomyces sp. NPDC002867]